MKMNGNIITKKLNAIETFATIKAIFLDLDNTLVDRDAAFQQYIRAFFLENQQGLKIEDLQFILQKDNHGYTKRAVFCTWLVAHFQLEHWTAERFWLDMKSRLATYIPPVAPGLKAQIKNWQSEYIVAILSNGGSQNQRAKLHHAGLDDLFEESQLFISGDLGVAKPDARFFEIALKRFGLQAKEALMIGDDLINDVEGAEAAGLWADKCDVFFPSMGQYTNHFF